MKQQGNKHKKGTSKMLKKKLNNKKGFTLAELLIVVAIIAVLVAISVPIFTSQLDKARTSTDEANVRAAKAAATTIMLDNGTASGTYYYDADKGKLVKDKAGITAYGKAGNANGKVIKVDITSNDSITITWD